MNENKIPLAFYCPNLERGSRGKDGKLAVSGELRPEVVDLVIVGFILAMHDAEKLFGHLGPDVSPRPGFGGATCEYHFVHRASFRFYKCIRDGGV